MQTLIFAAEQDSVFNSSTYSQKIKVAWNVPASQMTFLQFNFTVLSQMLG
jgi:hypothetical protein